LSGALIDPHESDAADRIPPVEGDLQPLAERELFWALIGEWERNASRRDEIVAEIDVRFRRETTILVVDACGFTRTVRGQGIIAFLAILERLDRIVRAAVESAGGRMLFREADNFFALFQDTSVAVACGAEILDAVDRENAEASPGEQLAVSIGIGHGRILLVGADMFGDEMNVASKVGEDLAGPRDLMLTEGARRHLGEMALPLDRRHLTVSGMDITAYLLRR
jgi:adenylate cyclase